MISNLVQAKAHDPIDATNTLFLIDREGANHSANSATVPDKENHRAANRSGNSSRSLSEAEDQARAYEDGLHLTPIPLSQIELADNSLITADSDLVLDDHGLNALCDKLGAP